MHDSHSFWTAVKPMEVTPQVRLTSKSIIYGKKVPIKLLVGPLHMPTEYTRAGNIAKRQPKPFNINDRAWLKLKFDGTTAIYPFEMAGTGYELVNDAIEGIHYEFI